MFKRSIHSFLLGTGLVGLCILSLGCGAESKPKQTGAEAPKTDQTAQITPSVTPELGQDLVGLWLGSAVINQSQLDAQLAVLPPEKQAEMKNFVANFLTTVMAMHYTSDGVFENEVEMSINGAAPIRDVSLGTYQVLSAAGDEMTIKVNEQMADGSTTDSQRMIRFSADRSQCEVMIPLGPDFKGIAAKLIFSKQEMTSVAENPETDSKSR